MSIAAIIAAFCAGLLSVVCAGCSGMALRGDSADDKAAKWFFFVLACGLGTAALALAYFAGAAQ